MFARIKLRILKRKSQELREKIIQVTSKLLNNEISYAEANEFYHKFDKQLLDLEHFGDNICAQYAGTEFLVVYRLNKVDRKMSLLYREILKHRAQEGLSTD